MRRRRAAAIGIALPLALAGLRPIDPAPVQSARDVCFARLQRVHPRGHVPDLPVRAIDADEASAARLGQWPWPRDRLALLVDRLADLGAAAIAFDGLFAEPDRMPPVRLAADPAVAGAPGASAGAALAALPDHDLRLAEAIRGRGLVPGVAGSRSAATGDPPGRAGPVEVGPSPAQGLPLAVGPTGLGPALAGAADGSAASAPRPSTGTGWSARRR